MVAGVAMAIIVVAALTNNFGLIFAVVAVILFVYALNTIPPKTVTHEITNKGIKTHGQLYSWKNVIAFWVSERGRHKVIYMEVRESINDINYDRMVLLAGKADLKKVVSYLVQHVDYLSSREASTNPIARLTQGAYQPLITFLGDTELPTAKQQPKKESAVKTG